MDRPTAHHPDCECEVDQLSERTVSASNEVISFAAHIAASHQLCSHNMLVAAYFMLEYMREVCQTADGEELDRKARETAERFYRYSASEWETSIRRKMN